MKYVVMIPARGGSKRLPRKNLLQFLGEPLLAHSISYPRRELGADCPVYVSTDDEEIAIISRQYGAEVIHRPDALATDTATTASVVKHASEWMVANGIEFDYMLLLQATNPLRPQGMLRECLDILERTHCSSLVTYTDSHKKLLRRKGDTMEPVNYYFGQRSQDMEKFYFENGLLYAMSRETCLKGIIQETTSYPMIIDHPFGECDIDTPEDFNLAEIYHKLYI